MKKRDDIIVWICNNIFLRFASKEYTKSLSAALEIGMRLIPFYRAGGIAIGLRPKDIEELLSIQDRYDYDPDSFSHGMKVLFDDIRMYYSQNKE